MLRIVIFAALIPLSGFADVHPKEPYRATVRHIERGGIGYDNGYTTLEVFLSSDPNRWILTPFLDVRGHIFDNGKWAANGGVGLRALWGDRVYGLNTYYDYRNTGRFHANQVGAGLETLGELFDFRLNGYLPVGAKNSSFYDPVFGAFSGHYMLLLQKRQTAMKGANAEFGFHFGQSESLDFYAAAGPYYFIGEGAPATWGGKARISATFKDALTLEVSDSYDRTFHNKFQGQIALHFSFGPKSKGKAANRLNDRMVQPVDRQEIIVIDTVKKNTVAIDPATGQPYFFVFVDNTSSSNGTYESPYHSLVQAQNNSSANDIIYVFPGDGTTTGMNAGITLKANQKFWGSGVGHLLPTTVGAISIPAQSSTSPTITNTDFDTLGDAITLATDNAISGFTIASSLHDAIFGADPHSLEISSCTFTNTTTYAVEATFSGNASISITNNHFLNNTNGIILNLSGTSTVVCSNNTFEGQTSSSSFPLTVVADSNTFTTLIKNNLFNGNAIGSILFNLTNVVDAGISILNNTLTNNTTGSAGVGLGSNIVIIPGGTTEQCSIVLATNTFSGNESNSLYLHTSGTFTNLTVTASTNTMSNNGTIGMGGGSAIACGSTCTHFTLNATNNTLSGLHDNGISTVGGTPSQTATITINNNTITDIGNTQSAIAIAQGSSTLNFTAKNNTINRCTGSGIFCFSSEFTNMTANITGNVITDCLNQQGNAASGISLDTYVTLAATVENNSLSDNADRGVAIGFFTSGNPTVCLTLSGNSSNTTPGYSLTNPGSGLFNLSPCNVDALNNGTIDKSGTTPVQSCPEGTVCP